MEPHINAITRTNTQTPFHWLGCSLWWPMLPCCKQAVLLCCTNLPAAADLKVPADACELRGKLASNLQDVTEECSLRQ